MIRLDLKRKILLKYQSGDSISEILRTVGVSRTTVRKYTNAYEEKIIKLKTSADNKSDTVDALVESVKGSLLSMR